MPIDPIKLLRDASRAARAPNAGNVRRLARQIGGPWGEALAVLSSIFGGSRSRPRPQDIQAAIELLESGGINVTGKRQPSQTPPPLPISQQIPPPVQDRGSSPSQPRRGVVRDIRDLPRAKPLPKATPIGRTRDDALDDWPEERTIDTRILSAPEITGQPVFQAEIETPQSSNVFSFAYDKDQGILYVTYKAPGPPVKKEKRTNSQGKTYTLYHRAHVRGPMYSYGGRMRRIPEHVYLGMRNAYSKGEFVWDELRIRGSIHGHRYPYTLVNPGELADGSVYVPRKATNKGFRVRSAYVPRVVESRELARPNEIVSLPERLR